MIQRIVTGLCLTALLVFALWMGGWVFSILYMLTLCCAMYEVFQAIRQAGHRVIEWPCWLCMALGLVLFNVAGSVGLLMPLVAGAFFLISVFVIFRSGPTLEDTLLSAMPLLCVLMPGICMLGLQNAPGRPFQLLLTILAFRFPGRFLQRPGTEAELAEGEIIGHFHRLRNAGERRQPGPQGADLLKQKRRVFVGGKRRYKKAVGMQPDHFNGLFADGTGAA